MSTFARDRSNSSDTSSSGSSYQLILDHILTYPGSYEIPLRTMYTLNCAPRAQPLPTHMSRAATPSSSASSSPVNQQFAWQDDHATQTFTNNLMQQISQLPSQPNSLPPSFITSFVKRCFPMDLVTVDFPQALTGLDYLKDLETRRRREVAAAMARLDIDRNTLGTGEDTLSKEYPGVLAWVKSIEEKERKVEALYTQLYIALRRWILINELSLLPFNKHNCIAMLNTLYPPAIAMQPTTKLTSTILKQQRDGFFKYITGVEKSGTRILSNLMQQGKRQGDDNGWPAACAIVQMYLQVANNMINDCADVGSVEDVSPRKKTEPKSRKGRKVDSGISISSSEGGRPPTRESAQEISSPVERPLPPSGSRSGTTLEKLARGLKTIGRNRTEATEMILHDEPTGDQPKTIRKIRSMGAISISHSSKSSVSSSRKGSHMPAFDIYEMRRHRMKYEAHTSPKLGGSHEV